MILQALNDFYHRLLNAEEDIAKPGFGEAKISFTLVLDGEGSLLEVQDLREKKGAKLRERLIRVPQAIKRSSGIASNFLWDNTSYVLGADAKGKPERALQSFAAFKELAHQLGDEIDEPEMRAVLSFLDSWEPSQSSELQDWEGIAGKNLVFRLDGERGFVHENKILQDAWLTHWSDNEDGIQGQCLVTGEKTSLARLHPSIKGVWGAQSSGANLVSFNLDAFTSYGKDQNYNAPVGEEAAFAYTTALNHLLKDGSRQRIQIGDASVVFWSEKQSRAEELFGWVLGGTNQVEDTALNQELALFLESLKQGLPYADLDPENPFYILGLSPNASRISVRFWLQSTVGQMQEQLGEHLRDLDIVRISEKQPENPPLWMLLRETAAHGKRENVPPLLAGEIARAVITGQPYPRSLLTSLISRIRADKQMGYLRAALLKAYLSRWRRLNEQYRNDPRSMEVTVSLDLENQNPAYRLGRLFAVLEDLQRSALGPKINATIRDKYLSSASSAPRATFPQLLRLAQAHIKKSQWGGRYDRDIQSVLEGVVDLPSTLNLEEQGLFFLGYYHQKAYRPEKQEADQSDSAAETKED